MTTYLLDTSAVIYLFEKRNPQVAALLSTVAPDPTFVMSIVTRGELAEGIKSASPHVLAQRMETKRRASAHGQWVQPDAAIADRWGELASVSPRSVRANDLWIAATALELAATLVTGDTRLSELVSRVGGSAICVSD